jgi:hypothetical protein
MLAAIAAPVAAALLGRFDLVLLYLGFALLILWKHRENIERLLAGTEPKVGAKRMLDRSAQEDRIARLRLIRTESIGPVTYRALLARFGSARRRWRPCRSSPPVAAAAFPASRCASRSNARWSVSMSSARVTCSSARGFTRRCLPRSSPRRPR